MRQPKVYLPTLVFAVVCVASVYGSFTIDGPGRALLPLTAVCTGMVVGIVLVAAYRSRGMSEHDVQERAARNSAEVRLTPRLVALFVLLGLALVASLVWFVALGGLRS